MISLAASLGMLWGRHWQRRSRRSKRWLRRRREVGPCDHHWLTAPPSHHSLPGYFPRHIYISFWICHEPEFVRACMSPLYRLCIRVFWLEQIYNIKWVYIRILSCYKWSSWADRRNRHIYQVFLSLLKKTKAPNFLLCVELINFIFLIKESNCVHRGDLKTDWAVRKTGWHIFWGWRTRAPRHDASDGLSQGAEVPIRFWIDYLPKPEHKTIFSGRGKKEGGLTGMKQQKKK